jgi:acyl-CoA synthetase (AMP-forming)/AMP-acid ligase II
MLITGAAPLSPEVNQQMKSIFPKVQIGQGYGVFLLPFAYFMCNKFKPGLTETCAVTTMWPVSQQCAVSGSSGQLVPGCVARVVKEDGSLAKYGESGELYIKSPSNAMGYANNIQALVVDIFCEAIYLSLCRTKETFVNGWLRTGDEVCIHENHEVFVIDRLKVFLNISTMNWF